MAIQTVKTGAAVNDGTGDDARTAFTKINQNFTNNSHAASRQVGTAAGNVMEVGAFGLGNTSVDPTNIPLAVGEKNVFCRKVIGDSTAAHGLPSGTWAMSTFTVDPIYAYAIFYPMNVRQDIYAGSLLLNNGSTTVKRFFRLWTESNTTVDGNGVIKKASPVVRLFADRIELNHEALEQNITFEKLGVGDYLIKGSTGFAQEGWYIEMPKDANGNALVAVVYKQLDNNDISVKTYAKKFDEETGDIVANTAKPRDIPETRWVDLRLQALPQTNPQPLSTDQTVNTNAE